MFLCIYCTKIIRDNEPFPPRCTCTVDIFRHQHFCSLFQCIGPNLTWKWPYHNEITQWIWLWMYQEQFVNVCITFLVRRWFAINVTWPVLKVKKHVHFDFISWSVWILILLAFGAITTLTFWLEISFYVEMDFFCALEMDSFVVLVIVTVFCSLLIVSLEKDFYVA